MQKIRFAAGADRAGRCGVEAFVRALQALLPGAGAEEGGEGKEGGEGSEEGGEEGSEEGGEEGGVWAALAAIAETGLEARGDSDDDGGDGTTLFSTVTQQRMSEF